ncbi:MAG: nickel-dependent lactate racemase [Verrucomicrobiae bacterium]|nr:nickel-dependent lactate racemase [Verrucomicrobiae bacterium]
MKVQLAYGQGCLAVDMPDGRTSLIEPSHAPGLLNEKAAVFDALDHPIESPPLKTLLRPDSRICIIFTDITRATPNERLIPWLLEKLSFLPREHIVLINALGTHRPNTPEELETMLTPFVVQNYEVLNHEAEDPEELIHFGSTRDGTPVLINRHAAEADLRIVTGFIEPHFFAGFSGGPKGILPGVAGLETVMSNHGAHPISNPQAAFGILDGNPIWEEMRDVALRVGPSFLLNVTLNPEKQITGVFAGHIIKAHREGAEFVRRSAMQKVDRPFEVVVTTNSGYPLDLNLYQGVKGMSAGARILQPGGALILAAECREGVPPDSPFDKLLRQAKNPAELLALITQAREPFPEQWQAHIQALIQNRADVYLHSSLPPEIVQATHLKPCPDITQTVMAELERRGPQARVAVLPQGPLTIPYLA